MIELVRYGSMEVIDARTGVTGQQFFVELTNGDVTVSLPVPEADYYRLMGVNVGSNYPQPSPTYASGVEVLPSEPEPDDGIPSI